MNRRTIKYLSLFLFSFVLLTGCSEKVFFVAKESPQFYKFNKNKLINKDAGIESTIAPYREKMDSEMNEILVYSEVELIKAKPNSTIGNWIADIVLHETQKHTKTKLDAAFQNYGGVRINSMPTGPITKGKIYEVMPFENMAVILHLPSETLIKLCDRIVAYGGWPTSEGITFEMGNDRKAKNILVDGKPLEKDRIYHIALADYVANGGDSCDFLKDADRTETGILIRDLIIDNLRALHKNGGKIDTKSEIRIKPN